MSHLTSKQRYTTGQLLERQYSISNISEIILADKSVISREIKRNCDKRNDEYNNDLAKRKLPLRTDASEFYGYKKWKAKKVGL